jgi:hypothetical protein
MNYEENLTLKIQHKYERFFLENRGFIFKNADW